VAFLLLALQLAVAGKELQVILQIISLLLGLMLAELYMLMLQPLALLSVLLLAAMWFVLR
jgi:hypothetical protein